ncbi:MAG: hypothetical protein KY467_02755 [Gemmatimonadetes bacterium]|nr:hypothetical protein [Gemmatimonadota bacterium]
MELHIEVIGLCMFVHPAEAEGTHVLMPHAHAAGVEQHFACCLFPGQSKKVPIEGHAIEFDVKGSGSLYLPDDPPVINAGRYANKTVDAAQWGTKPRGSVAARVTIPPAAVIHYAETAEYEVIVDGTSDDRKPLTHKVVWRITDITGPVTWNVQRLTYSNGHGPAPAPTPSSGTFPYTAGATVKVTVECQPRPIPTEPIPYNEEAHHFRAYLALFRPPVGKSVRLKMKSDTSALRQTPDLPEDPAALRDQPFSLAYNCMLGQAPAG